MTIEPAVRRSRVERTAEGLQVSIPARRDPLIQMFLGFWLCAWLLGEGFAIREVFTGSAEKQQMLFLSAWLGIWTLAGGSVLLYLMRMIAGREIVTVGNSLLRVRKNLFGFGRVREYDAARVANLRVVPDLFVRFDESTSALKLRWGSGGPIAFDYEGATVHIGPGLDEAEASQVIADLKSAYPFREQAEEK